MDANTAHDTARATLKCDAPSRTAISLPNRSEHADLSRSKKYPGCEPALPLREAVKDMVRWIRQNAA